MDKENKNKFKVLCFDIYLKEVEAEKNVKDALDEFNFENLDFINNKDFRKEQLSLFGEI